MMLVDNPLDYVNTTLTTVDPNMLNFNDQYTTEWWRKKYPLFPDCYHEIFEAISKGNVKQWKKERMRIIKKELKKKAKIKGKKKPKKHFKVDIKYGTYVLDF